MVGQGNVDFWRPFPDWGNREWAEVATKMSLSTAILLREDAKNCTYASWMECVVGLIAVIINGGTELPEDNRLQVLNASDKCLSDKECHAFVGIVDDIWVALQKIGIPMPQANRDGTWCLLRHVVV